MKRRGKIVLDTFKRSIPAAAAILLAYLGAAAVFFLYGLPGEPFLYVTLLLAALCAVLFLAALGRESARAEKREQMLREILTQAPLPDPATLAEEDYSQAIGMLRDRLGELEGRYAAERQDERDYYTAWVHQIKTPISVMRLELGNIPEENSGALGAELFRIEQYVDMALTYIRLESSVNDLVVREYPLDEMIRGTVRKFAPMFVAKRLRLVYEGTADCVVTDKKWFSCILEQLISNAVKYTPAGCITVSAANGKLTVSDTGIGIAPEDLPRIFERGYTGQNGRLEKRSSGLGLYLCKRSAELLGIALTVTSEIGKGSSFVLDFGDKCLIPQKR